MANVDVYAAATGKASSVENVSMGSFTGTAPTTTTINLGFAPKWCEIFTPTGIITWRKYGYGMAAANCVKSIAAGTTTLDTASNVLFTGNTIVLTAAVCVNADVISWIAMG